MGVKVHKRNLHLVWVLAKTDFLLRYQSSILGYIWTLLKPLLLFSILYVVFNSMFRIGADSGEYYSLRLILGIMVFMFFSDATGAMLKIFLTKKALVQKIPLPGWIYILSSMLHSSMIFGLNLLVIAVFFLFQHYVPSLQAIAFFLLYCILLAIIMIAFGFLTAGIYVRFRDLAMIWEVILRALFYATPIIYPLSFLPEIYQKVALIGNPLAFIVHYMNSALLEDVYPAAWQLSVFSAAAFIALILCIVVYRKMSTRVAEFI